MSKSDRWVFHPSYLHVLANDNFEGIVYAIGFRKSNRNKKLILFRLNIEGDFGWYAVSEGQVINIMNIAKNYFANVFNNKAMEALRKRIDREFDLKL